MVAKASDGTAAPGESVIPAKVAGPVWLRVTVTAGALCQFAYSLDGSHFSLAGETFHAVPGRWVGAKVGLFAASSGAAGGRADFAWFNVEPAS